MNEQNKEVLTNGMSDKDLIGYCEMHCQSERALFNEDQINRMIELAGIPIERRVVGWHSLHENMEKLCELARERMTGKTAELPTATIITFPLAPAMHFNEVKVVTDSHHQISPKELFGLTVAFEHKKPINFLDFAENYSSSEGFLPTYLTDDTYVEGSCLSSDHKAKVVAAMLLKSLEQAGYVIVRKVEEPPKYDPCKNPLHEPGDYNTRQ